MIQAWIPSAMSALRFALAMLWIELASSAHAGRLAYLAIALVAAASDFIDGRIARRLRVASESGRWLDALADVTFVLCALTAESYAGAIPIYIPILIAISFSQYALDSILIPKRTPAPIKNAPAPIGIAAEPTKGAAGPIKSRLGHWGGIINYALVIALATAPPPATIGVIIHFASPLIAVFYMAAITERALQYGTR